MGYIFNFEDSVLSDKCHHAYSGMISGILQKLAMGLIRPLAGDNVLDIGCGTGAASIPFIEMGSRLTCIDPSVYMLDLAESHIGSRAEFIRGCGEDLPYEDNYFNHSILVSTLEFAQNPEKMLEEAFRVTKDSVYIGFWNKYAIGGTRRRICEFFPELSAPYENAEFFSIWEIRKMIKKMLGNVPMFGRSVYMISPSKNAFAIAAENSRIAQRFPLGVFIGLRVFLVPKFRTKPLSLTVTGRSPVVLNGCGAAMEVNNDGCASL
ncbi:class I SAM-dependent methyltransferase [Desulforegula conservatrix]|uniref:class I SAM-dependent methyltransferase n=1 Tax=Desulforegula conservatrix TaxID=153026 RepID=UPI0004063E22|nr:class I SAM-dependent methyltransferase [Desulforegula conservatrix]